MAKVIEEEFERSVQGQIQKATSLGPELRFGSMTGRFEENSITSKTLCMRDPLTAQNSIFVFYQFLKISLIFLL